jgi:hypothetical protein
MASEYKILGQSQGVTAASQENINLYPDPNHERYTATQDFTMPNPTTAAGAQNSIWPFISGNTDGHMSQHWALNSNSTYGGTQTSGQTGQVRFSGHQHNGNSQRVWQLDTAKTGQLIAGRTYTLNLWAHAHQDHGTDHYGQHAITNLNFYDGANWQPIIHNAASHTGSYLNDGTHSNAGEQIQTNQNNERGASVSNWNGGWRQWYKTFTAAGTAPFNMEVRLRQYNTNYWNRIYLDNVYLTEGAVPKALIPTKAPDGSSGNALALHTSPFTTRSEGWAALPYQSTTIRKFTGEWKTLYAVPDLVGASAVCSTITISNSGSTTNTYRIAVQKFGESLESKHMIAFDHPISATQMETLTLGITLGRQDKVMVQSDSERVTFSLFGSENTL